MRRVIALLAGLALLLTMLPGVALANPSAELETSGERIAGSWIVGLRNDVDPSSAAPDVARRAGGRVGLVYEHALNGFSFKGSDSAAAALLNDSRVVSVLADRPLALIEDSVPTGVSRIDATLAHSTETGAGARVAILDTGIDLDHEDLAANIDTATDKNCIGTGDPDDGHSHGTHVAGTVAAVDNGIGVIGVAPQATLIAVKVLDDSGSGSWESVICGIDHVTGLNLNDVSADDIDVANMSLGGKGSATGCDDGGLHESICNSVASGAIYAVAAGNDSDDAANHVPAAYPEVLTVSAFQDTDGDETDAGCTGFPFTTCDEEFASFSNYGPIVDVIAPGVRINSTTPDNTYGSKSGTSMAAPHVAGVAALLRAADQTLTVAAVEAILEGTGQCPDNNQNAGGDATCDGQGTWAGDPETRAEPMVNAKWAVDAATEPSEPDTTAPAAPTGLTATAGDASVTLDWADNAEPDLASYNVYRSETSLSGYLPIANVSSSAYTDTTAANGTTYYYVVTAVDSSTNESAHSNEASATPADTAPAAPTGLTATAGDASVTLDWADNTEGDLASYNVYRSTSSGSGYAVIATVTSSAHIDTTAANGTTYYYVVTAVDAVGNESAYSNEAQATPTAQTVAHIGDLDASSTTQGPRWTAEVTITVHDAGHLAVDGATASGTFTYNGNSVAASCTTGTAGTCTVSLSDIHKRYSSVTFTVGNITHDTLVLIYDSSANHDPDGDSDGTQISVVKPA